ncbi:hypothetical protein SAMN05880570_2566 [Paenibacillus sp. RU4T]|nr:hypothetical protein SAMN05880555_2567 [Paenibacillus sp. RU4X]SIR08236.1 hypothetical protein SAMN05880570_2566 [Paenibacillus sp. RU4T]
MIRREGHLLTGLLNGLALSLPFWAACAAWLATR